MKLIYKGKFTSEDDLPVREHPEGYVPFKEAEDMKKLALAMNLISIPLFILTFGLFYRRGMPYMGDAPFAASIGMLLALCMLFPHEFLHAICFKGEVELWTNFKQGMLFVVGIEDMTKARFVFLSMLPNLVFGWIPFLLFLLHPQWLVMGAMGAMCIPMGIGDYYNVYNCLTQVPKGALVYMSGMHSYWYTPHEAA